MTNFKGTKGKWRLKHSESKNAWNIIGTELGGKYKLARVPYLKVDEMYVDTNVVRERIAHLDALLMSRAPEMLEMLERLVDQLSTSESLIFPSDIELLYEAKQLIENSTTI